MAHYTLSISDSEVRIIEDIKMGRLDGNLFTYDGDDSTKIIEAIRASDREARDTLLGRIATVYGQMLHDRAKAAGERLGRDAAERAFATFAFGEPTPEPLEAPSPSDPQVDADVVELADTEQTPEDQEDQPTEQVEQTEEPAQPRRRGRRPA